MPFWVPLTCTRQSGRRSHYLLGVGGAVAGAVHQYCLVGWISCAVGHRAAHRVQHDALHLVRVVHREASGDPAAQRLAGERSPIRPDRLQHVQQLVDVVRDLQRMLGLAAVAVTDEVDSPARKVLGVRAQIAHIRLGVPRDLMQHQQHRLRRVTSPQVARPVRTRL
jgi:hypothetical protein